MLTLTFIWETLWQLLLNVCKQISKLSDSCQTIVHSTLRQVTKLRDKGRMQKIPGRFTFLRVKPCPWLWNESQHHITFLKKLSSSQEHNVIISFPRFSFIILSFEDKSKKLWKKGGVLIGKLNITYEFLTKANYGTM